MLRFGADEGCFDRLEVNRRDLRVDNYWASYTQLRIEQYRFDHSLALWGIGAFRSILYLSVDMLPFPLNLTSLKLSTKSSCSKVSNLSRRQHKPVIVSQLYCPILLVSLFFFRSNQPPALSNLFLLQSVEGMKLVFVELDQATSDPEGSATRKIVKDADRLVSCLVNKVPLFQDADKLVLSLDFCWVIF
ncbi:hypothetical protein RHGRI_007717 [Rhododendron griersonianum]|uniref:Uncharacterized protein n=1 Tax=Rhododendron griersonianum TaxID=479676 RepID=A0AAV6KYP7_9ERIC|nr:hypothetical protein RHGRI_007717 [Rhododendron griersonianum]